MMEGSSDRQKGNSHFMGLPTPSKLPCIRTTAETNHTFSLVPSTELHAQPSPSADYVSPMALSFVDGSQYRPEGQVQLTTSDMSMSSHNLAHAAHSVHSAPANLVFNTSPPVPLPSPGEMDFDLSPLTSPWMEAYKNDTPRQSASNKRAASPNTDGQPRFSRSRPSPAVRGAHSTSSCQSRFSILVGSSEALAEAEVSNIRCPRSGERPWD